MSEPDRWQDLIDAAAREEAQRPAPPPERRGRSRLHLLWGMLGGMLAVLLAFWLIYQETAGPTQQQLEAGRRLALALARDKVLQYAQVHGRYPETLAQALTVDLELGYRRLDAGFELTATLPGGRTLTVTEK